MFSVLFLFWFGIQVSGAGTAGPAGVPAPAAAGLLVQSTDGGRTWQDRGDWLPEGVQPAGFWAAGGEFFLRTDRALYRGHIAPVAPAWQKEWLPESEITGIFPGSPGPYAVSHGSGLFQSLPGTGLWVPLHPMLKDQAVYCLLETRGGALLAGGEPGLFRSVDRGRTWQAVFEAGAVTTIVEGDGVLLAGDARGVLRSTDGGARWERVLTGDGPAFHLRRLDEGFAAILDGGDRGNGLFRSAGDGASWQRLGEPLPPALRDIYDLEPAGDFLFAAGQAGIFRSADQGRTWERVRPAPPGNPTIVRLVAAGSVIFALTMPGC